MLGLISIMQYANWTWFTCTGRQQPAICTNTCLCCHATRLQAQGSYHTMPHLAPHTWHPPAHIHTHNTVAKTQLSARIPTILLCNLYLPLGNWAYGHSTESLHFMMRDCTSSTWKTSIHSVNKVRTFIASLQWYKLQVK